ncbi:MAG: AAA family ATPase [Defluviitaleaceae bacterium]|nr:AAA family ATPase [Defluviitaleaceae bacterium]
MNATNDFDKAKKENLETGNLENEFREWMKLPRKPGEETHAQKTIANFIKWLKKNFLQCKDIKLDVTNLFYITQEQAFSETRTKILSSSFFKEKTKPQNKKYLRSAMRYYSDFLKDRNSSVSFVRSDDETTRPELQEALYERAITPLEPFNYTPYTKSNFLTEVYMTAEKYDDIAALLNRKKNIILQGAPGVGKSYLAKLLAYSLIGFKDKGKVTTVQLHQSYSYEDFIEGYRPNENGGFTLKCGIFYEFCEEARNNDGNYYFIIDEINRGNLSKIMGELMLLIECDKRSEEFAVPLTYSDEPFYVPENVFIIGMMNTADRSLAMLDYALRRRFSFVPIEPAFANSDFIKYIKKDGEALGERIIAEMTALNVDIKKDLGAGFQIGHSYFCNCDDINEQWYESVLKYEILPLLEEYWFDNEKQHSKWIKGLLSDEKNPD